MQIEIKTGTIFEKTMQAFDEGQKIVIHRGGTGSGKTYDVMHRNKFKKWFGVENKTVNKQIKRGMKKDITRRVRMDADMDMRIRELADMMGVSQSAVIRVLIKNSIVQIDGADERLPEAKAKQGFT